MPSFRSVSTLDIASTAVNGAQAINTPAGAASGDILLFMVECDPACSITPPGSAVQLGSTQNGDDPYSAVDHQQRCYQATHDGVAGSYSFTFASDPGDQGANIACAAIQNAGGTGAVSQLINDTIGIQNVSGPAITAASTSVVVALFNGRANTMTCVWDAPFTERLDSEYWGYRGIADAPGTGSSMNATGTFNSPTNQMWTMVEVSSVAVASPLRQGFTPQTWRP